MSASRPFRVRVVSPLAATEADLARRQRRYGAHAGPDTQVTVDNLAGGPAALDTSDDVLESAAAIVRQSALLATAQCDAILVDCVFDPAVEELREATGLPIFGPTRVTLPLVTLVAGRFSIVARTERQCELLAETVARYGFRPALQSSREAAGGLPLFMPGLVALRAMEHLWTDDLWPR